MNAARLLLRVSVLPPLLALACATPAGGEPCIDYGSYLHVAGCLPVPDFAVAIAVEGSLACIAARDSGLLVADVSDPGAPAVVSQHATSGRAFGVALAGDLAYVAAGLGGLEVVDVSEPALPVTVGRLDTPGLAFAVALARGLAFVADRTGGLVIADLSDPRAPVLTGRIDTPGLASGLAIEGTIVYVGAEEDGLQVIDCTDPAAPVIIGSLPIPGGADGVVVAGDHAYLAGCDLVIADISDPTAPREVGSLNASLANLAVRGGLAYLPENCSARFRVLDLSAPEKPADAGIVQLADAGWNVTLAGDHAYVTGPSQITVIDLTETGSPPPVATVRLGWNAQGIALHGALAYLAGGGQLAIADLAVPGSPLVLGRLDGITAFGDPVIAWPLVFVPSAGLEIVDVSRPDAPVHVGGLELDFELARDVALIGSRALLATGSPEIVCLDVADPASPRVVDRLPIPGRAHGIDLHGTLAYVACDTAGLAVLDFAVPDAPVLRALLDTPGEAWDACVIGEHAFVACGRTGLLVADVSDPDHPVLIGQAATQGPAWRIAVNSGCAYVTCHRELEVFEVTDPARPCFLGSAYSERANSVAARGGWIAVAGWEGFLIYPAQCPLAEPVEVTGLAAVEGGGAVEITWRCAGAEDLIGFDVQRSDHPMSGYVAISLEPIQPPGPYIWRDAAPLRGATGWYRLAAIDRTGGSTFFGPVPASHGGASRFALAAGFPQPFTPADTWATIGFELPQRSSATLRLYDPAGRLVSELAAGVLEAGAHQARWNGRDHVGRAVASGVYFYRLESAGLSAARSLVWVR